MLEDRPSLQQDKVFQDLAAYRKADTFLVVVCLSSFLFFSFK